MLAWMMKETRQPTSQAIETLTAFLPLLYADGFSPVVNWSGREKLNDGSFTLPYPTYHPLVKEFFRHVASDGWLDYDYNPEQGYRMFKDENVIKSASLSQIKTMLTFCVRGERFSDGHWGEMIEKGYIRQLLERLNELKSRPLLNNGEE
jgi:hypothetical protein